MKTKVDEKQMRVDAKHFYTQQSGFVAAVNETLNEENVQRNLTF